MALRSNAKYEFGLPFARFMPLNDDGTIPTATRMFGGTGPFDFSGVSDTSDVTLTIKIDAASPVDVSVDVSTASDTSAVTVDELVTSLGASTLSSNDLSASKAEGKDGSDRIKIESTDTASPPTWVQLYGEFAEIALFGQGFPLKFVKADTLQTAGVTPTLKEDETFTATDAQGRDTEIISDGYRKGSSISITDSAKDRELKALMLGGTYDSSTGIFEAGTSESTRYQFLVEFYFPYYSRGTNQEGDIVGYVKKLIRNAKGTLGDDSHAREWSTGNYTLTAVTYKDENDNLLADEQETELTIAEYNALDLLNV